MPSPGYHHHHHHHQHQHHGRNGPPTPHHHHHGGMHQHHHFGQRTPNQHHMGHHGGKGKGGPPTPHGGKGDFRLRREDSNREQHNTREARKAQPQPFTLEARTQIVEKKILRLKDFDERERIKMNHPGCMTQQDCDFIFSCQLNHFNMSHGNAKRVKAHPFQKKGEEPQDVAAPQDDSQDKKETAAEMLQRLQDKTKEASKGATGSPKKPTVDSPVPSSANATLMKALDAAKEEKAAKTAGDEAKKEEGPALEKENTRFGRIGLSSTKAPRQMIDAGARQATKLGFAEGSSDAKWEKLTIEVEEIYFRSDSVT